MRWARRKYLSRRTDFPKPPQFLNDLAVDTKGNLYVSDSGEHDAAGFKGKGGAIYQIQTGGGGFRGQGRRESHGALDNRGRKEPSVEGSQWANDGQRVSLARWSIRCPANCCAFASVTAKPPRWPTASKGATVLFSIGLAGFTSVVGRRERCHVIPRPGAKAVLLASGFESAADLCYDGPNKRILVPDMKAGTLTALPAQVPGQEVDDSPLSIDSAVAFPDLKWTGWSAETAAGKQNPLRPLVLTHAGDGSNRVFVATQHGVVHVFPNDQKAKQTKVFLDIQSKVLYQDKENEQGLLGLAFRPITKKAVPFMFSTRSSPIKRPMFWHASRSARKIRIRRTPLRKRSC